MANIDAKRDGRECAPPVLKMQVFDRLITPQSGWTCKDERALPTVFLYLKYGELLWEYLEHSRI